MQLLHVLLSALRCLFLCLPWSTWSVSGKIPGVIFVEVGQKIIFPIALSWVVLEMLLWGNHKRSWFKLLFSTHQVCCQRGSVFSFPFPYDFDLFEYDRMVSVTWGIMEVSFEILSWNPTRNWPRFMPRNTSLVLVLNFFFQMCLFEMIDLLIFKHHCFRRWGSFFIL